MANHVDSDDRSFRTSLLRAAAGGLAALIVTFGITGVLTVVGRDDGAGGPAMEAPEPTELVQEETPSPPAESEAEETTPPSPAAPSPTPAESTETTLGQVTVQVLDAVGSGTQAQQAAAVLRKLGYTVVVVNPTPRRVDTTTVLATPGHEDDARALRREDDRFAVIEENVDFNQSVDLHILVGPDFTP